MIKKGAELTWLKLVVVSLVIKKTQFGWVALLKIGLGKQDDLVPTAKETKPQKESFFFRNLRGVLLAVARLAEIGDPPNDDVRRAVVSNECADLWETQSPSGPLVLKRSNGSGWRETRKSSRKHLNRKDQTGNSS